MELKYDKLSELYESIIAERFSDILYHATSTTSLMGILEDDTLNLGFRKHDEFNSDKTTDFSPKKEWYMSFARSLDSKFIKERARAGPFCILQVDGRKLSQRFKGKPHQYHNNKTGRPDNGLSRVAQASEFEDRLFHNSPLIDLNEIKIDKILFFVSRYDPEEDVKFYENLGWYIAKKAAEKKGFATEIITSLRSR